MAKKKKISAKNPLPTLVKTLSSPLLDLKKDNKPTQFLFGATFTAPDIRHYINLFRTQAKREWTEENMMTFELNHPIISGQINISVIRLRKKQGEARWCEILLRNQDPNVTTPISIPLNREFVAVYLPKESMKDVA